MGVLSPERYFGYSKSSLTRQDRRSRQAIQIGYAAQAAAGITLNTTDVTSGVVFSNANLTAAHDAASSWAARIIASGAGKSSGKWYFEVLLDVSNVGALSGCGVGISSSTSSQTGQVSLNHASMNRYQGYAANGWTGRFNGVNNFIAYRSSFTTADVIGCAFDLDNRQMWVSKNNVWQGGGDPSTLTTPSHSNVSFNADTYWPTLWLDDGGTGSRPKMTARFAPGSFTYAVPTGFTAYGA